MVIINLYLKVYGVNWFHEGWINTEYFINKKNFSVESVPSARHIDHKTLKIHGHLCHLTLSFTKHTNRQSTISSQPSLSVTSQVILSNQ